MSVRSRRQMIFSLFILALVIALIAGAAGYATGYGVNSEKRISALAENKSITEQNKIILAENEQLAAIKHDAEELERLRTENGELKAKVDALGKEKEDLVAKLSEMENNTVLSGEVPTETSIEEEFTGDDMIGTPQIEENSNKKLMDKITKWFIIGIVGILVLMGVAMVLVPKKHKDDEDDEDDELEEYEEFDEAEDYVEEEETEELVEEPEVEEEIEEAETFEENIEETKVISVIKEESDGEESEEKEISDVDVIEEQTEIVFDEESEEILSKEAVSEEEETHVPDTLEELMLESIKRNGK